MNPINSVGGNSPVQKINTTPVQRQTPVDGASKPSIQDRVELSGLGHLLGSLKNNGIRADKVAAVKAQIEAGTYEDDHKLNVAVDRLMDDLSK